MEDFHRDQRTGRTSREHDQNQGDAPAHDGTPRTASEPADARSEAWDGLLRSARGERTLLVAP